MPNLVLLAGPPGAGKSTWAQTFFDLKYSIVSSDAIRRKLAGSLKAAHGDREHFDPWPVFYRQIEEHLAHSVDVIADATFLTRKHRDRARAVADRTGSRLHLVLFTNHWEATFRNAARDEDARVPESVMEGMMLLLTETTRDIAQETYDSITRIEAFN